MKAKFNQVGFFLNCMELIDSVILEPKLKFDDCGLLVCGFDTSNVAYLKVFVKKEFFIEYDGGNSEACINLKNFIDILKKIPLKNVDVSIEIDKDNWFVVKGKSTRSFKYKIPIIEKEENEMKKEKKDMTFEVEVITYSKLFSELLDVSFMDKSNIVLYCTEYYLNTQDDNPQFGLSAQRIRKSTITQIKCNGKVRGKYRNKGYLMNVVSRIVKISEKVMIEFSRDYPISLSCDSDVLNVWFLLAPLIEDEPEEHEPEEMDDEK